MLNGRTIENLDKFKSIFYSQISEIYGTHDWIADDSYKFEDQIFQIFRKYEGFTLVDAEIVVKYYNLDCDYMLLTADEFKRCGGVNCLKTPV